MYKKIMMIGITAALFLLVGCTAGQVSQSQVTVSGIGTVMVAPDMVQMNIGFSHVAPTTSEAKKEVDSKMAQIFSILKEENVEDKDIKTVALNYDVEMEWTSGRSKIVGQRARQTIVVTLRDTVNNPEKFPMLLDKITAIDKVEIGNIVFDTETKVELFKQSRELAYQKAYDKAAQYASFSGRKVAKVLSISESRSKDVFFVPALQSNVATARMYDSGASGGAAVPSGEQEITTEITVTFLMK